MPSTDQLDQCHFQTDMLSRHILAISEQFFPKLEVIKDNAITFWTPTSDLCREWPSKCTRQPNSCKKHEKEPEGVCMLVLGTRENTQWRLSFKMAVVFKGHGGSHRAVIWSPLPSPDNSLPQTQGTGAVAGLVYRPWMGLLLSSPQLGQNRWGEHAIRWIITHCWCGGFSSSRATS
jgi:hypothetical protein